jgi:hypothetical protein
MVINGTTVRTPKLGGVVITDEPIWSSKTGRGTDGDMLGEIVAWKTTIAVTWPPLTFSESKKIRNAIKTGGSFFKIKYYDDDVSKMVEKTVYVGNMPRTVYSLVDSCRRHTDVSISFIEQ